MVVCEQGLMRSIIHTVRLHRLLWIWMMVLCAACGTLAADRAHGERSWVFDDTNDFAWWQHPEKAALVNHRSSGGDSVFSDNHEDLSSLPLPSRAAKSHNVQWRRMHRTLSSDNSTAVPETPWFSLSVATNISTHEVQEHAAELVQLPSARNIFVMSVTRNVTETSTSVFCPLNVLSNESTVTIFMFAMVGMTDQVVAAGELLTVMPSATLCGITDDNNVSVVVDLQFVLDPLSNATSPLFHCTLAPDVLFAADFLSRLCLDFLEVPVETVLLHHQEIRNTTDTLSSNDTTVLWISFSFIGPNSALIASRLTSSTLSALNAIGATDLSWSDAPSSFTPQPDILPYVPVFSCVVDGSLTAASFVSRLAGAVQVSPSSIVVLSFVQSLSTASSVFAAPVIRRMHQSTSLMMASGSFARVNFTFIGPQAVVASSALLALSSQTLQLLGIYNVTVVIQPSGTPSPRTSAPTGTLGPNRKTADKIAIAVLSSVGSAASLGLLIALGRYWVHASEDDDYDDDDASSRQAMNTTEAVPMLQVPASFRPPPLRVASPPPPSPSKSTFAHSGPDYSDLL